MDTNQIIVKIGQRVYNKLYPRVRDQHVKENYFGNPILSKEDGNILISEKLLSNTPLMVSRFGSTELHCLTNYLEKTELSKLNSFHRIFKQIKGDSLHWMDRVRFNMNTQSGFFPTDDDSLDRFSKLYFDLIPGIDIFGVWYNYYEDIVTHHYCPNSSLVPLESIEPYYFNNPWSQHLENKKVLVIHPFDSSINSQYKKREYLFENKNVLPSFELKTIKAVQSVALNKTDFSSWFDALESMRLQMLQTDFDIALIGAGAYGLPLAAYAKQMGKQAIHFGGSLQILFGIKGTRWDDNPDINKFYNEHWVRPLKEETPKEFRILENGAYW